MQRFNEVSDYIFLVLSSFGSSARKRFHSSPASEMLHSSLFLTFVDRMHHFQHQLTSSSVCIRVPAGLAPSRPAPASTAIPSCIYRGRQRQALTKSSAMKKQQRMRGVVKSAGGYILHQAPVI